MQALSTKPAHPSVAFPLIHFKVSIFLIWSIFIVKGFFYCSFMPLWEGYDEWSHFGHIQSLVENKSLFADRDKSVSSEVLNSILNTPVAWEVRYYTDSLLTHDQYWKLSNIKRNELQANIQNISASNLNTSPDSPFKIYEALQPPLYYWIMSSFYYPIKDIHLLDRVYILRFINILISSMAIPVLFLIAWNTTKEYFLPLASITLLCSLPEFMINVSRIGNESLGIFLFSLLILIAIVSFQNEKYSNKSAIMLGLCLGLGLLTKAYFLTAIPAIAAIYLWKIYKNSYFPVVLNHAMKSYGIGFLISGWWYIRNRIISNTWTGLNESLLLKKMNFLNYVEGIREVDWIAAIDSILVSHIWFGAWSSLIVRSWMYHFLFFLIALSILGIFLVFISSKNIRDSIIILGMFYGFYWVGQLYNVLLLFLSKGASTSMGWYMYCVISSQLILFLVGVFYFRKYLNKNIIFSFILLCFIALDLYTVNFVSIPYYTGLISHRPNGFLENIHLSDYTHIGIVELLSRISINKPEWISPVMISVLWISHFCVNILLLVIPRKSFILHQDEDMKSHKTHSPQ